MFVSMKLENESNTIPNNTIRLRQPLRSHGSSVVVDLCNQMGFDCSCQPKTFTDAKLSTIVHAK